MVTHFINLEEFLMSHAEGVDVKRRRVLIASTAAMGAVGVAAIATPFVRSWYPKCKAEAAGAHLFQDLKANSKQDKWLLSNIVVNRFFLSNVPKRWWIIYQK